MMLIDHVMHNGGMVLVIARWMTGGWKVVVSMLQVSDEGIYSCLIANKAGELRHNITLTVLIPPSIKAGQRNQTVVSGLQTSLSCVAKGKPTPTITWSKVQ